MYSNSDRKMDKKRISPFSLFPQGRTKPITVTPISGNQIFTKCRESTEANAVNKIEQEDQQIPIIKPNAKPDD